MQTPEMQAWRHNLEKIPGLINIARISMLLSLLTFHLLTGKAPYVPRVNSLTFQSNELYPWAVVYGGLILLSILLPQWQRQSENLPNVNAVADITMMAWLMHIAGGVNSGFGILILPFLTTSCLLSYGRYPLLYASYAAMLIVFSTYWVAHNDANLDMLHLWTNAVIVIATAYLVAALTAYAATYLIRSNKALRIQSQILDSYKNLTDMAFNHVQEAVVVLDARGKVWLSNQKANDYFPSLSAEQTSSLFQPLMTYWQTHRTHAFDMDALLQQQQMRVRAHPLNAGNTPLLMLFMRADEEVAQEAMAIKLTALGQLTANLAHEIRNPMSAIRQANGLLQEERIDPVNQRLHSIIDNNVGRIDKMLEEIGSLNKSDKIHKQVINLLDFWHDFYQEFILTRPEAAHCITIQPDEGQLSVWCDPAHLQQIMWNLMNNAWRHCQKNAGAIKIFFRHQGEDEMAIVVTDNGEGVSNENQAHLFEPFFTTAIGGTGLGLYVARELAQANLGRLSYQAHVNGFEIVLPKAINE